MNDAVIIREDGGAWELVTGDGQKLFTPDVVIGAKELLKPLEAYYKVEEKDGLYLAELEATPENIKEIKVILLKDGERNFHVGDITDLEAKFYVEKESFYPHSYEWEVTFTDDQGDVTEMKYFGNYKMVNELEEIALPEEVQNLMEES